MKFAKNYLFIYLFIFILIPSHLLSNNLKAITVQNTVVQEKVDDLVFLNMSLFIPSNKSST